ncbi:Uncharacterised protein r2_g67 [Pycnogonum litorale]
MLKCYICIIFRYMSVLACINSNQIPRMINTSKSTRSVWMKPGRQNWFENIILHWKGADFKENLRMKRYTFEKLVRILKPFIGKNDTRFRKCVPVHTRIAITLWRLGTNAEYRTIGHLFGLGKSTCVQIVNEVTKVMKTNLLQKYIKMPKEDRLLQVIAGFQRKAGFPQVGGVIDGTHIKILSPVENAYLCFYVCVFLRLSIVLLLC